MSSLKDTTELEWMDNVTGFAQSTIPGGSFLALFAQGGEPTESTQGTEAVGGTYARQTIPWSAIQAPTTVPLLDNSTPITFTLMPAGTWNAVAICRAGAAGIDDQIAFGNLVSPVTTALNESVTIDATKLTFTTTPVNMTPYIHAKFLDHFFLLNQFTAPTLHMSLHKSPPGDAGVGEFADASYARQIPTWVAATAGSGPSAGFGVSRNTGVVTFQDLNVSDTPYDWWGMFDSAIGGSDNFIGRFDRSPDLAIQTSDKVEFASAEIEIGVN